MKTILLILLFALSNYAQADVNVKDYHFLCHDNPLYAQRNIVEIKLDSNGLLKNPHSDQLFDLHFSATQRSVDSNSSNYSFGSTKKYLDHSVLKKFGLTGTERLIKVDLYRNIPARTSLSYSSSSIKNSLQAPVLSAFFEGFRNGEETGLLTFTVITDDKTEKEFTVKQIYYSLVSNSLTIGASNSKKNSVTYNIKMGYVHSRGHFNTIKDININLTPFSHQRGGKTTCKINGMDILN